MCCEHEFVHQSQPSVVRRNATLETDASVMILLCAVELRYTSRGIRTSSVFRREVLGTKQTLTSWWVFHSDLCTSKIEGF